MGKSQTHTAGKSGPSGSTKISAPSRAIRNAEKPKSAGLEGSPPEITAKERHRRIAEAAYYRALQRGFHGGSDLEDWFESEAEIDRLILRT